MRTDFSLQSSLPDRSEVELRTAVHDSNLAFGNSFVRWFLSLLSGKHVYVEGNLYLSRYYLVGNGSGNKHELYLHILHDVDRYRWEHNHPWRWFLSLILRGWYRQDVFHANTGGHRSENIRWYSLFRGQRTYHAIRDLPRGPAWTLVLVSPKTSEQWGYWDKDRGVHVPDSDIEALHSHTIRFGSKHTVD